MKALEEKLSDTGKAQQKDKAAEARKAAEIFVADALPKVDAGAAVPRLIQKVEMGENGADLLGAVADLLKQRSFRGVAVLAGEADGTAHLAVSVSPDFTDRFKAADLVGQLAPIIGGKGGGKADLARGAGKEPAKIPDLLWRAGELLG